LGLGFQYQKLPKTTKHVFEGFRYRYQ